MIAPTRAPRRDDHRLRAQVPLTGNVEFAIRPATERMQES